MTATQCDVTNPLFTYFYCPSYPAAVLFAILFSITTVAHIYQACSYRKPFATILIVACLWEILGYMIRSLSILSPFDAGLYTAQMLFILLAPLWLNAFIYMLVGRTIHFFLDDDRIFTIKARKLTLIFVIFDITALLIQGTGGSMSSSDDMNTVLTGLHVYTAGVAIQILFNAFFLAVVIQFQRTALPILKSSVHAKKHKDCIYLLRLVYAVTILILLRNFYRLAEFASGQGNTITRHEWYAYIFDALPIFAAMVLLNVFYFGTRLNGPRCDFTEENEVRKTTREARGGRSFRLFGKVIRLPSIPRLKMQKGVGLSLFGRKSQAEGKQMSSSMEEIKVYSQV